MTFFGAIAGAILLGAIYWPEQVGEWIARVERGRRDEEASHDD